MFRRGGYNNRFFQRFGFFDKTTAERLGKGRLWVHAVSVGEVFIALKWIRSFKARHPEARFILSVTTTTALEIAEKEATPWLEPIANPIDFFFVTNSFFRRFKPIALIMVEGDLWVQRLLRAKKLNIPTALITARLSQRSESRFQKFGWIIRSIFNRLDFIGYPTLHDQERWQALGIHPAHSSVTGNIKYDQEGGLLVQPPADMKEVFATLGWGEKDPVLLAGSTYCLEEEKAVIEAWRSLCQRFPLLRLILAPRHAERRQEIVAFLKEQKMTVALRSEKKTLEATHASFSDVEKSKSDVFLLDTTGELQSWYLAATIVFIGKSLGMKTARGGQNLVEPLALGRPVLVGPFMNNFQPLVSELLSASGILEVHHAQEIELALERLLLAPEESAALVQRGMQVLAQHQGAADRTCIAIEELLKNCSQKKLF